jgi:hypothetical protein
MSRPQIVNRTQVIARRISLLFFLVASAAAAGTVTGTITNGTNGKPAAGVQVILIQLQGGMQPVESTKTDANGHYQITNAGVGGQMPMLIRAVYHDVLYHAPLTPGKTVVDVTVYEPTSKPGAVSVSTHAVIIQPNGVELLVWEEFTVENRTQPPMTYSLDGGSFLFTLPDGAQINEVDAAGSSGMPVVQSTLDKGKNLKAIAYAFKPGENQVRISYKLPYTANQLKLHLVSPYLAERLVVASPPTVQIAADGLVSGQPEQGFSIYMHDTVAANSPVNINISGTAPPPQQQNAASSPASGGGQSGGEVGPPSADDSQNPSVNSRLDQSGAEAPTTAATTMPARLDSLKWILVAGFAGIFALGLIFLWRRPQTIPASAAGGAVAVGATAVLPAKSVSRVPVSLNSAFAVVAEANKHVSGGLDELKDTLFRLELRRQAGTVSEDEYARERARIEQLLRDLVRG